MEGARAWNKQRGGWGLDTEGGGRAGSRWDVGGEWRRRDVGGEERRREVTGVDEEGGGRVGIILEGVWTEMRASNRMGRVESERGGRGSLGEEFRQRLQLCQRALLTQSL